VTVAVAPVAPVMPAVVWPVIIAVVTPVASVATIPILRLHLRGETEEPEQGYDKKQEEFSHGSDRA
jgi:hypothetical protein